MALYVNGNKIGGGGNSKMQELTQEEYDELTTEEKNNGTVYYITDANGDGESFQPIIYSENEREIGVWVDGKPLYEKSVKVLKSSISSGANTVVHNISNFGDLADAFVTWIYNNGDCNYGTEINSDNNSYIKTVYDIGPADFTLKIGSDAYSIISYVLVTLRYTKSTDTAGSGTWTPQGVPAVHYSTDEQIVGTWIDGSTVYEKTYSGLSLNCDNANSWYSIGVAWGNIDKIVSSHIIDQYGQSIAGTVGNITVSSEKEIALNLVMNNRTIEDVTIRYTKSTS